MEAMIDIIANSGIVSYLVLFAVLAISGVGISAGEEAVLLLVGHLVSQGVLLLGIALPVSIAGVIAADALGYHVGRRGLKWFPRLCKKIHSRHIEGRLNDSKFIFLSRFIPHVRGLFPIAAGMHGVSWPKYLRWNIPATLVFVPLVLLLGVFLGFYVFYLIGAVALACFIIFIVKHVCSGSKAE